MAVDNLSWMVIYTQDYLNKHDDLATYKAKLSELVKNFDEDEANALADVISAFAILLRGKPN